ncbi:hypothetical protein [Candidatus Electrothrix sp.]|uniref:hypothetical protein n=1 Tax=Candidatus Electrothrix sp. TaxID=2170559 RepID=UPI0040579EEA
MKTTGDFYEHRGLIAFTGAFLAAIALTGCGSEKLTDLQVQYENLPNSQTEIALQEEKTLTIGEHSGTPLMEQVTDPAIKDLVWAIPFEQPTTISEPRVMVESLTTTLPESTYPETTYGEQSTQCWLNDVSGPLHEVVNTLEKKSLLYATQPLTDCSGIFHRVVQGLKDQCPAKKFPSLEKYRDSRDIARWYHEQGKLQLVKNAVDSTDLLQPGAVLFFGKNGSQYREFSVEELLNPQKGIAHLGIVVNVHKDASGQVVHYELFHGYGRKGKTPASVTDWHKRTPTRASYPPFGNGRQQWVAVARL